jgi:hypothetical protein
MTSEGFRKAALALPGVVESAHMNHPDFRVHGKIFASLGYPDDEFGMVKVTPEQQAAFIERSPDAFEPCRGAWGRNGATAVHLRFVSKAVLQAALEAAYGNIAPPAKRKQRGATGKPRPAQRNPRDSSRPPLR